MFAYNVSLRLPHHSQCPYLPNFGFIDNVFISPDLITNEKLIENKLIKGIAINSFDKKKNKYGWRALKIIK